MNAFSLTNVLPTDLSNALDSQASAQLQGMNVRSLHQRAVVQHYHSVPMATVVLTARRALSITNLSK